MKRITIVEDDYAIQDVLDIALNSTYQLSIFSKADPLFDNAAPSALPDLYIIDKQLAGISGLDLCRHIKTNEATKHIPVIMLSASPQIHQLASEAGANDALEKPFKMQQLRNMVAKHLKREAA